MVDRSASSSLKGYYYQFDKTILEILRQSDSASKVTVEGIEDVDVASPSGVTAIQCKYYAAQRFSESSLRRPVTLMLTDFVQRRIPIRYQLYAHFGRPSSINTAFSVERLKKLISQRGANMLVDLCLQDEISDQQLERFREVFTFLPGPNYGTQHNAVLDALQAHFGCDAAEADLHFYNNALRSVYDLAIRARASEREITKKDFLLKIDDKTYLFNQWYLQLRGREQYLRYVRKRLDAQRLFQTQRQVLVYLSDSVCRTAADTCALGAAIEGIAQAHFRAGKSLYDAKPWTFVLGCDSRLITEVKQYLLRKCIPFNDGYETVQFTPRLFETPPVINKKLCRSKSACTDTIGKASYYLRIVAESTYSGHLIDLERPDVVVDLSGDATPPRLGLDNTQVLRFAHCSVEDLLPMLS